MRCAVVVLALMAVLGACTATDSSSGPVATPRPTTDAVATPTVAATPPPEPTATPDTATSVATDGRPTIAELVASPFTLNIAHAGGDLIGPHSTIFAMAQSIEEGSVVLELDVQLTGDGVLVVQHDDTVDKTTEATGPVADLTLDELQALDNAYWFSPDCWPCQDLAEDRYIHRGVRTGDVEPPEGYGPDDFAVPTFRQVVQRFPDVAFAVEIKGSGFAAFPAAQALAQEIEALDIADSTIVVSFDDGVVAAFEALAPGVATSPGTQTLTDWVLFGTPLPASTTVVQVPPAFNGIPVLTPAFWQLADEAGVEVWVWMDDQDAQDNLDFYQDLIAQGADGIIAGRPNELAAASL